MRCNTGVPPELLLDQHLVAEYRELHIPLASLRARNWRYVSPIPPILVLGKGHISFWRDKQLYLARRHSAIVEEMHKRGFRTNYTVWDLDDVPEEFLHDWNPTIRDSLLLRDRILQKVAMKPTWYRMYGSSLQDFEEYAYLLLHSEVSY